MVLAVRPGERAGEPDHRPGGSSSAFATQRALTRIDGIDIYDSSRLESEGITDIPSLAKSDLVATMVTTRLPVERIVDWTDQADAAAPARRRQDEDVIDDRVHRLRAIGIRTASGVLARVTARSATSSAT